MAKKFIGRFYFKKTSYGNLLGEFSSNSDPKIYTESADITEGKKYETFIGQYISTWHAGNSQEVAILKIEPKHETDDNLFSLTWTIGSRSEEHTSELQSLRHIVCRLL